MDGTGELRQPTALVAQKELKALAAEELAAGVLRLDQAVGVQEQGCEWVRS